MKRTASISDCGRYRYVLARYDLQGGLLASRGVVNFIMLNPSTADGLEDDPTVRRCVGFARAWEFGALVVTNLYAFRATDPAALWRADDPVGPHNDAAIDCWAGDAQLVVCAWGAQAARKPRWYQVAGRLRGLGIPLHALGFTAKGDPVHPLYQPATARPVRWLEPIGARPAPTA